MKIKIKIPNKMIRNKKLLKFKETIFDFFSSLNYSVVIYIAATILILIYIFKIIYPETQEAYLKGLNHNNLSYNATSSLTNISLIDPTFIIFTCIFMMIAYFIYKYITDYSDYQ